MFKKMPVYNVSLESEFRLINLNHVEQILLHVNVPVNPDAVDTPACEVKMFSGESIVVLIDFDTMFSQVQAVVGVIDELGNLE